MRYTPEMICVTTDSVNFVCNSLALYVLLFSGNVELLESMYLYFVFIFEVC